MNTVYPIIGMSPGNSYFKDEVVKILVKKVIDKYGKAAVLIADMPAISTYMALGYPENRARRDKALPQGNNLRNKVVRAITELSYSSDQVKIIDWASEVEPNPAYKEKYKQIIDLYDKNELFKEAADRTTKTVLESFNKEGLEINSAIKIAVHYLLCELAFMEFAPEYFKVQQVAYIYHNQWPVYESYIAGEFDGQKRGYLRFDIISTP
jgi:cyclo(L-tyrosyl-L-tyrosyl) synthase